MAIGISGIVILSSGCVDDMFLTLTDQEKYMNPFTNQIETGSNQWDYRWVKEAGEVIYTNDEYYDPRLDVNLNRVDIESPPIIKKKMNCHNKW